MSIHPIQGFKNLSTGKKVAVVAGTAAAVGATVYAGIKGKAALGDKFVKNPKGILRAIGKGYHEIGSGIVKFVSGKFNNAKNAVSGFYNNNIKGKSLKDIAKSAKDAIVNKLPKFQKAAEEAAEKAQA